MHASYNCCRDTQSVSAPVLPVHVVHSFSGMPPLCCLYPEKFLHEWHHSVRANRRATQSCGISQEARASHTHGRISTPVLGPPLAGAAAPPLPQPAVWPPADLLPLPWLPLQPLPSSRLLPASADAAPPVGLPTAFAACVVQRGAALVVAAAACCVLRCHPCRLLPRRLTLRDQQ